jgi:hypothetical protein
LAIIALSNRIERVLQQFGELKPGGSRLAKLAHYDASRTA